MPQPGHDGRSRAHKWLWRYPGMPMNAFINDLSDVVKETDPMSACYAIVVADNERLPRGSVARRTVQLAPYEPGHSERQVMGSVATEWSNTMIFCGTG